MVVPVTARGQETRARLLAAAEKVFGEKSYFQVSIADITREAGAGNGTFYLYFPSKEDVFRELVQQRGHELRMVTHVATEGAHDRKQAERAGFAAFCDFISQHRALYRIVRQAEFVDLALFKEYYQLFADGYCRALAVAMDRGEIARMDPEVLAYCLMGIGDFLGMRWILWTGEAIDPTAFDEAMRFIQYGLTGPRQQETQGGETAR
ncbi:MAG TPA: TetR/AcrR family transcriptional regulator [Chloroflexota bacterium]|nr:TetR/AcrR family transcriptional regulator [Chloroflexota bacterium]